MGRPGRSEPSQGRYATLEPRIQHVSEVTVRKKWKKLSTSDHSAVKGVILSARDHSRGRQGKYGIMHATDDCIDEISNRLTESISRIPFPPATEEQHLDYEANLTRIAKVEDQLNAHTHSMNLLRAQIAKEERLLKQAQAETDHLEHSLKSNETYRRDRSKTLHPAAQHLGVDQKDMRSLSLPDDVRNVHRQHGIETLQNDQDLVPILHQLHSHLATIQQNMVGLQETNDAVHRSSTTLDQHPLSHFDR